MSIQTKIQSITPAWAQQKLNELTQVQTEGSFRQRDARERAIHRYAQDMKAGKWITTHQGIGFDDKGRLIDGQNRLWAIVKSGCTVDMLVTTGINHNGKVTAMDVIDGGSPRTMAQALQVSHGHGGEAVELAMLARQIVRMVSGVSKLRQEKKSPQVSTAQALFILKDLNYEASFERFCAIVALRKLRRGPFTAPWCWYHMVSPKKAEKFALEYATLEGLSKGAPALSLFRYFSNTNSARRVAKSDLEKQSISASAMKSFDQGTQVGNLIPSVKDALTWLVDLNPTHATKIAEMVLT